MSHEFTQPIQANERADILDILRGFALLGIALANYGTLSQYFFISQETRLALPTANVDQWLNGINTIFINGKFYSLFSLLFGVGFAIVFSRNTARGQNGVSVFYRRLGVLALFGLIHCLLIWDGDILFFYAVVGSFLPLFRNVSDKNLLLVALVLIFSPLLFDAVKVVSDGNWSMGNLIIGHLQKIDQSLGITDENVGTWLQVNSSYKDLLQWNSSGFLWGWHLRLDSNRIPKVLAMFLIGLYVGRNGLFLKPEKNKKLLQKLQVAGLTIGISAGLASLWFEHDNQRLPEAGGLWDTLFHALNVAPLSIAYAATLALWYLNPKTKKILLTLRPVGRMALTNYIMQAVFGIIIFYGIGFGLGSDLGPAYYMPIAIAVFSFQIIYSHLWFRHFTYGPLEWIWRQLTYGKRLSIRKTEIKLT
ncbi:DUF418 domain-containing protein [Algoriphagus lacus]|uniref:DUF418 domain-containing protein n=1 Tax=Algoriphagus lacus TaxID=2056311 RepID=A0A418PNQ5_9BACT|nr:DUF418 domain-containing protein [Algoriphagus lacus]RIW13620.1 DUF418 domain-containing protein [Algoriphagus lacus]